MSRTITRIEGPPGAGKSRELAREAIRLRVQDGIASEQMVLLALTSANQRRLTRYLDVEARQAGELGSAIAVLTLDAWLLGLLNQSVHPPQKPWALLKEQEVRLILGTALRASLSPEHALYAASQSRSLGPLLADFVRQCQLRGITAAQLQGVADGQEASRLAVLTPLYDQFQAQCEAARLLTYTDLTRRVSQALEAGAIILPEVILIDEAQELSLAQYDLLKRFSSRLVLAGNEHFSIRGLRGAQPSAFKAFFQADPITLVPKQANFRGNDAVLSLLNGFLPAPVWEAHGVDREQLQSQVKFGFYTDPVEEAEALAALVSDFVARGTVDDRPAQWQDCVILLRSSRYKAHLVQALMQRQIPFRQDGFSEKTLQTQRALYDLLQTLSDWETLGLTIDSFSSKVALLRQWQGVTLTIAEKETIGENNNRHLKRWLEDVFEQSGQPDALQYLRQAQPNEGAWLLPLWLDAETTAPALFNVVQALIALYVKWQASGDLVGLMQGALQHLAEPQFTADAVAFEPVLLAELQDFWVSVGQLVDRYQGMTGQGLKLNVVLKHYEALWVGQDRSKEPSNGVRLLSIHQVQGETFPWVAIPFLVGDEFPHRRNQTELLSPAEIVLLGDGFSVPLDDSEEKRLLAVGMTRASQQLILTCHQEDEGDAVLPSAFYTELLAGKRRLLGQVSEHAVCWCATPDTAGGTVCALDYCHRHSFRISGVSEPGLEDVLPENLYARYQSASAWAQLEAQPHEPVYPADHVLNISPTAITNYMKCPRQYYYKHVLRLPEEGTQAASLGVLVHRVMEMFNRQAEPGQYQVERLREFAEALFLFETDPARFQAAGYGERERYELAQMSPLKRDALRTMLLGAVTDLAAKGYFDRYGTLKAVHAERAMENVTIPGIERCQFKGKLDAVIQLADGSWEVVDYKTYGPGKYRAKWETCEQNFAETLTPLPDDAALSHAERFAAKMNPVYPIDYQLPLYYWACEQDPVYQGRLAGIALQLVRPAFPDNPEQGSIRLRLESEEIARHQAQLVEDIQRYVVSPILENEHFAATPVAGACAYCAYASICDEGQAAMEEGETV